MKKTTPLKLKDVKQNWYVVDCDGMIIGRLASRVARLIQGKHKPNYSPYLNNGDKVILINTSKVRWTGNKSKDKLYKKHSGYLGGLKARTLAWMMAKNPNAVLERAIYGMLPKNKMRDRYMSNLRCYAGSDHRHQAQKPVVIEIND